MQVRHALAAVAAVVDHDAVAGFGDVEFLRQGRGRQQQMAEHEEEPGEPTADAGELQLAFIEIEENGSGFLKRVTVGAGA